VKPKAVVDRLEVAIGMDGVPRRLVTAIESELVGYFGLPAIQASERAEAVQAAANRVICDRAASCEGLGITPVLVLLGAASDVVAGFCHVLPSDPLPVVKVKQQRLHAEAISSAIRSLGFDQFERFGARILNEIGAEHSHITPHSGDQGIDFFGDLSLGKFHEVPAPFLKLSRDIVISFVGQAKHYPNSALGPDVVRELIGAVSLARTKTFSYPDVDIFRDLVMRPFSPVVTLLFTTGNISKGAIELARSAGIVARSGEQLGVFLADRGVGIVETPQGREFSAAAFMAWLNAA